MPHIPQLKNSERLDLNGPVLHVVVSNRQRSEGYLELPPGATLARHHRNVEEHLTQAAGDSLVTVFDDGGNPILHHLSHGSELRIPPGTEHIHANPYGRASLTKWQFEGDVTEIVAAQRREARRIAEEKKA